MCVMHTLIMETNISIKELRKHKKWTQGAMAEHFGVDKSTVWRWENIEIPDRGVTRKAIEREWEQMVLEQVEKAQ